MQDRTNALEAANIITLQMVEEAAPKISVDPRGALQRDRALRLAGRSRIMLEIRTSSLKHTPFHFCHSAQRRGATTPGHKGAGVSHFASKRPNGVLECLVSNRFLCGAQWEMSARLGRDRVAMVCGPRPPRVVVPFQVQGVSNRHIRCISVQWS